MFEPLRVKSGELTTDKILDALREGHRVTVRAELLGGVHEVALRHDRAVFYCDTPTTLHEHEDEDRIRVCVLRMGYAKGQRQCGSWPQWPLARLQMRV